MDKHFCETILLQMRGHTGLGNLGAEKAIGTCRIPEAGGDQCKDPPRQALSCRSQTMPGFVWPDFFSGNAIEYRVSRMDRVIQASS